MIFLLFYHHAIQWPFPESELEVPTIYKAHVRAYAFKIWPETLLTVPPF